MRSCNPDTCQYLESAAGRVRAKGLTVDAICRIGEASLEIAWTAEPHSAAAVVMATHGRTGLLRSALGSVASAVVHSGNTSVVLVHPAAWRGAENRLVATRRWLTGKCGRRTEATTPPHRTRRVGPHRVDTARGDRVRRESRSRRGVDSALNRARATLQQQRASGRIVKLTSVATDRNTDDFVKRCVAAWHHHDSDLMLDPVDALAEVNRPWSPVHRQQPGPVYRPCGTRVCGTRA